METCSLHWQSQQFEVTHWRSEGLARSRNFSRVFALELAQGGVHIRRQG